MLNYWNVLVFCGAVPSCRGNLPLCFHCKAQQHCGLCCGWDGSRSDVFVTKDVPKTEGDSAPEFSGIFEVCICVLQI